MSKNADYTYHVTSVNVVNSGIQQNGKNVGQAFALGSFKFTTNDGKEGTRLFKMFDTANQTPAAKMLAMVEAGTNEFYMRGRFIEGRLKDMNDESKGRVQELHARFVDTVEERSAYVEAQKAARAKAQADA